jgi:ribosomal protein L2
MAGLVERLEYDPNRSGYIALVRYPAGEAAYKGC